MKRTLTITLLLVALQISAQEIASLNVSAGDVGRLDCPVCVNLDQINHNEDSGSLLLFEVVGNKQVPVPCQLETGHSTRLWFILAGETAKGESRRFVLLRQEGNPASTPVRLHKKHQSLNLSYQDHPVLDYQFETMYPPEGVPVLFKRSGFIHPLWSPDGQVLSRIQAPDHYHHYGIWGPWTKTHINGREVDFWNLMKGEGTVRFSGFLSEIEGPVYSGFKALQEHIDFGGRGEDRVAMNEVLDVRAWNVGKGDAWLIDYTTTLNTPLDSGIMLDAYRYGGGIGYRATGDWHKDNCTVLTSEGKDRLTADGSKAKWCIVEGASVSEKGRSGILFMGHTSNRDFPEPMRVWPVDQNRGRGDMYFEFCPIRHKDWKLDEGRDYTLKYRLLVFDGNVSAEEAEMYWQGFANPPRVEILGPDK
ncbi:MAG TPA: hypothetical protein ENO20_04975 [Bacteroides sp.]|nr:hypothetical protein [Bacteroides sp.]